MKNLEKLPAFAASGLVHVVIEASRGMTAKCKYDPKADLFVFGRQLPHGLVYPFDWGFIPSTRGEDGDPLDALVLHDGACPVGCLIRWRALAVLQVLQRERGKIKRNDRFVLRPSADQLAKEEYRLNQQLEGELEQFFLSAVVNVGKSLRFLAWRGEDKAVAAIKRASSL